MNRISLTIPIATEPQPALPDPERRTAWIVGSLALAMVAGAILVCIVLGSGAP